MRRAPNLRNRVDQLSERTLGSALLCQKNYADAEPLLLTAYEGMKQRRSRFRNPAEPTSVFPKPSMR